MRRIVAVPAVFLVVILLLVNCVRNQETNRGTPQAWTVTIAAWQQEATVTAQAFYAYQAIATPACQP